MLKLEVRSLACFSRAGACRKDYRAQNYCGLTEYFLAQRIWRPMAVRPEPSFDVTIPLPLLRQHTLVQQAGHHGVDTAITSASAVTSSLPSDSSANPTRTLPDHSYQAYPASTSAED